jgi:hypothetical protein
MLYHVSMATQMQTQRKATGKSSSATKETNYCIVDFLDLDTSLFSFTAPKVNQYNGKSIGIKYNGKQLYVKYAPHTSPFGITTSTDKGKGTEYKDKYEGDAKITGYSVAVSFPKEYEDDPYYQKACELDEFFIQSCIKNSVSWGLGGSKMVPIARDAIAGYDDKGYNGKWKRLLKWSYKDVKNAAGEVLDREYLEYPPRMEFGIPTVAITEALNERGLMHQTAILKPTFFDADGNKIEQVSSEDISTVLPKWSRISCLALWSGIALGTYGATLKPKVQQVRVYPNQRLDADECLLDDDEEEEAPSMLIGGLDTDIAPVRALTSVTASAAASAPDEFVGEDIPLDEDEPAPAAVPTVAKPSVKAIPVRTLKIAPK